MTIGPIFVIALPLGVALLVLGNINRSLYLALAACLTLITFVILLGHSRSILFGSGAGMVLAIVLGGAKRRWVAVVVVILAIFLLASTIADYLSRRPILKFENNSVKLAPSASSRMQYAFPVAWKMFLANPISGVGMGRQNYSQASNKYGRSLAHAHNMFLQLLSDRGGPATIAFVIFYFGALLRAIKLYRQTKNTESRSLWGAVIGSLLGLTLHLQAEPMVAANRTFFIDTILFGFLALPFCIPVSASRPRKIVRKY